MFRPVAQFGRAAVSKTAGWGFESLLACHEQVCWEIRKRNMSSKSDTGKPSIVNTLLLAISTAMLIAGVGSYYWFQDLAIMPVRVVGLIVVAVVASLVAAQSDSGATFFRFLKESDIERRKVVWPTNQETLQTAMMVIIVTILISLFLAAVDWILGATIRTLVGG